MSKAYKEVLQVMADAILDLQKQVEELRTENLFRKEEIKALKGFNNK